MEQKETLEKITYRGVDIILPEGVSAEDVIVEKTRECIDARFERPMMLHKRSPETRNVRSASKAELELAKSGEVPRMNVALKDCEGTIIMPYGTLPSDVMPDDIETAKMMWYDPVLIERAGEIAGEGVFWIDVSF